MYKSSLLSRVTFNPNILAGKPIIRDLRISVEMILELLSKGESIEHILEDYPDLELEDIYASLSYAHQLISQEQILEKETKMLI